MVASLRRTVALCSLLLVLGRVPLGVAQQGVGAWSGGEALERSTARLQKIGARLTKPRGHKDMNDNKSSNTSGRVLEAGETRAREGALPFGGAVTPVPPPLLPAYSLNKTTPTNNNKTTLGSLNLLPAVGSLLSGKAKEGSRRLRGTKREDKEVVRLRGRHEESTHSGTEVLYDGAKHDSLVTHTQTAKAHTITQTLTSHDHGPRSLQPLQQIQQRPLMWPEQEQDSQAAARLVALSQRLNLTEGQREELRGWVKDTAIDLIKQANPNPSPALSLRPPRQLDSPPSPPTTASAPLLLSTRDPVLLTPLVDALHSTPLSSPPRTLQLIDSDGDVDLLPSERLGLSGEERGAVRDALKASALGLIKQAVASTLGTRGQATDNTHTQAEEGQGVEESRQQVTRPDGGSLLNPLPHLPHLSLNVTDPSHRALPSSVSSPLLPLNRDPTQPLPPLGSRLNLTESERSQLRQAVRDVAIGLLKEVRTGEPDKQRSSPSSAMAMLLPPEPKDSRAALIEAIRDVAAARRQQPTAQAMGSAASASGSPSSSSGDDLLFHTNRYANANAPPHRHLPVTLGLQTQPQQQQDPYQPQGQQPQGSLAARVSGLSDGEKAELREAIKGAALAILREAAAREFGIATMAKAATAVAATGGL